MPINTSLGKGSKNVLTESPSIKIKWLFPNQKNVGIKNTVGFCHLEIGGHNIQHHFTWMFLIDKNITVILLV